MAVRRKKRRDWEDSSSSSSGSGGDGGEGLSAAARERAEDEAIAARRARLRAAGPAERAPPAAPPPLAPPPSHHTANGEGRAADDEGHALRVALLEIRDKPGDASRGRRKRGREESPEDDGGGDDFDMFAETPEGCGEGRRVRRGKAARGVGADDADDAEGYARLRVDEEMDGGRYVAGAALGRGAFAGVYKATEVASGRRVAVKVLRSNDVMRRAGRAEVGVLERIKVADEGDRHHCVRMLGSFEHGGHGVIVFEELELNLREVVRQFGGGGGIRLAAVRLYASQLLRALCLLEKLGLIHADIKPDNALVSADKRIVKLCDFGSVMDEKAGETDATPYLVSRYYRAPEVILGALPYTRALDIWSLGCVLYELYTGRIAFPGRTNSAMLLLFQEARGAVPGRLLRRAAFRERHFDDGGRFYAQKGGDEDVRPVRMPERGIKSESMRSATIAAATEDDEKGGAPALADVIEAMLVIDPVKRISPSEALKMAFFSSS